MPKGDTSVEVDRLTMSDPDLEPAAKAMAVRIKREIATAPGNRWNKTGKLLGSVRADGEQVVVASDRLQRDELAERFSDEIVPADLDEATSDAIAQAVYDSIKVEPAR